MNTLIFHTALLGEALINRLIRFGFRRILTVATVASPLLLLSYSAFRFDDAAARARSVTFGCEQIVIALIVALILRGAFALLYELVAARFYRPESRDARTLT